MVGRSQGFFTGMERTLDLTLGSEKLLMAEILSSKVKEI